MKNTAKNRVKDGAQNAVKNGDAAVTVTRFAPSPTGYLHLGHAYAALFAWHAAQPRGAGGVDGAPGGGSGGGPGGRGRFLLRIEDIDEGRCRPEFEAAILEDLAWLGEGLPGWGWETPVRRQSAHLDDYRAALAKLDRLGLLYPCFCTRAEIRAEAARAASAPHGPASQGPASQGPASQDGQEGSAPQGLGGAIYPGTCRRLDPHQRAAKAAGGASVALRLDMERAVAMAGALYWDERARGRIRARPEAFGDVVLARKDTPTSYHLAVTLDDHLQGVSLVTRGEDLLESTHIHRLLQALLGLRTPVYLHHKLVTDDRGRRFAKRDRAATIRALRAAGVSPAELRRRAGFEAD